MSTNRIASLLTAGASPSYSRHVLMETPARALAFLAGISTNGAIRAAMNAYGYTEDDHKEGWSLLNTVSGQKAPAAPTVPGVVPDSRAADAVAALDAWNRKAFPRLRAALERLHPVQGAFLFEGLALSTGAEAVPTVTVFLQRLAALESSPERKGTKKADHAALATLVRRGVTKTERAKLRALVAVAESGPPPIVVPGPDPDVAIATQEARIALRVWYDDWAATARVVFTNRNDLIRLGLGKRRGPASKTTATPPVAVATPPTPPIIVPAK